jgi:hypothetical protein
MTTEQFWQLIEQSRGATSSGDIRIAFLDKAIRALKPAEMVAFEGHLWDMLSLSYRREIMAVATIIQPTCTHASFDAVRAWMVLEGKEFFDRVTEEPRNLVERAPRGRVPWIPDGELLLRLVARVYRAATGDDLPTLPRTVPYVLKGQRWTEHDLPDMFPDLWKKYRR